HTRTRTRTHTHTRNLTQPPTRIHTSHPPTPTQSNESTGRCAAANRWAWPGSPPKRGLRKRDARVASIRTRSVPALGRTQPRPPTPPHARAQSGAERGGAAGGSRGLQKDGRGRVPM